MNTKTISSAEFLSQVRREQANGLTYNEASAVVLERSGVTGPELSNTKSVPLNLKFQEAVQSLMREKGWGQGQYELAFATVSRMPEFANASDVKMLDGSVLARRAEEFQRLIVACADKNGLTLPKDWTRCYQLVCASEEGKKLLGQMHTPSQELAMPSGKLTPGKVLNPSATDSETRRRPRREPITAETPAQRAARLQAA
jgi:hypothetical protein